MNLKNFAIVNDALARMNVNSDTNLQEGDNTNKKNLKKIPSKKSTLLKHAPLAAPEDDSDDLAEYAQVKDVYGLDGVVGTHQQTNDPQLFSFMHDGSSSTSKSNSKMRHRRDKGPSNISFRFFFCSNALPFLFPI